MSDVMKQRIQMKVNAMREDIPNMSPMKLINVVSRFNSICANPISDGVSITRRSFLDPEHNLFDVFTYLTVGKAQIFH